MRSDDLTPLLTRKNGQDLGFRTGVVLTWDPLTGENTISVAGAVLEDLPILNNTDVVGIAAGDTVALVRFQNAYFIMGRIIPAGSSQLAASALKTTFHTAEFSNFAISSAGTWLVPGHTVNESAPAGYSLLNLMATVSGTVKNTRAVTDSVTLMDLVTQDVEAGRRAPMSLSAVNSLLYDPGTTYDLRVKVQTGGGNWSAHADNHLIVYGLAFWTRD